MKAGAIKRGRNPRFPYVPVIIRADGSTHNTNTKNAYETRAEAIAFAEKWIAHAESVWAAKAAAKAAKEV